MRSIVEMLELIATGRMIDAEVRDRARLLLFTLDPAAWQRTLHA